MSKKVVQAKIVGTILGVGVKVEGEKGILLSSNTKDEIIKKEFEKNNPDLEIIWTEN